MRNNPYDFYSNNGLHRIFNNHAGKSLARGGVSVPQPALGIGYAELTAPVPLLVSYTPILKQPSNSPVVSYDDTTIKTVTPALNIDTFPRGGYYGEALAEVY